ncbi:MAG TPA: alpha/beta hydrolase, partial [Chloroflexota bacterium]
SRSSWSGPDLATLLAPHCTVYNYDRRGRGESGDALPFAVEREVEDIAALIAAAGGTACLYGHSSGAALALEAAFRLGRRVQKLAIYDAPYDDDPAARPAWQQYLHQLTDYLAADRRGDAVALFLHYLGVPAAHIDGTRHGPSWPVLEAIAPTLAYDHTALLGEDRAVPIERAAQISVPTLVLHGGASDPFMHATARALSQALPQATLRALEGQQHDVDVAVLAPVLVAFFSADQRQSSTERVLP